MMDNDLITRLAREAGFRREGVAFFSASAVARGDGTFSAVLDEALRRFAALVAEECAKIAESTSEGEGRDGDNLYGEESGEAIRAKFKGPANG